jgi:hypothetical protein
LFSFHYLTILHFFFFKFLQSESPSPEQIIAERRLTRSGLLTSESSASLPAKGPNSSNNIFQFKNFDFENYTPQVKSVFDVACLEKIHSLFEDIDECRKQSVDKLKALIEEHVKTIAAAETAAAAAATSAATDTSNPVDVTFLDPSRNNNPSNNVNSKLSHPSSSSSSSSSSSAAFIEPVIGTSLAARLRNDMNRNKETSKLSPTERRSIRLSLLEKELDELMCKYEMRKWKCLVPGKAYPLTGEAILKTDPSTLAGRSMYTPAEDDLLLRGIVTFGEDWKKIKSDLLPSKEEQLLQFRFSQTTSINSSDENKFKKFLKLEKEKKLRDHKWTHEEDLKLLRGFQIYGEKWPMISIFFLPHRNRKEIKLRWTSLVREWGRTGSDQKRSKYEGVMTPSMRDFLVWLKNGTYPFSKKSNRNNLMPHQEVNMHPHHSQYQHHQYHHTDHSWMNLNPIINHTFVLPTNSLQPHLMLPHPSQSQRRDPTLSSVHNSYHMPGSMGMGMGMGTGMNKDPNIPVHIPIHPNVLPSHTQSTGISSRDLPLNKKAHPATIPISASMSMPAPHISHISHPYNTNHQQINGMDLSSNTSRSYPHTNRFKVIDQGTIEEDELSSDDDDNYDNQEKPVHQQTIISSDMELQSDSYRGPYESSVSPDQESIPSSNSNDFNNSTSTSDSCDQNSFIQESPLILNEKATNISWADEFADRGEDSIISLSFLHHSVDSKF